ncbi:MAG: hypothetical protein AAF988_08375 [Pseudomonadota bacterium]
MFLTSHYSPYATPTPNWESGLLKKISSIDEMLAVHFGDYDPVKENSRRVLQDKWSSGYLPPNMERYDFVDEETGLVAPTFCSRVESPRFEIRFPLGYKAIPHAYERHTRFWNALGIDVSYGMLPLTDRECGFIAPYDRTNHRFLTDGTLEVHKDSKPGIPIVILPHSTGCLCTDRNRQDPRKEILYSQLFSGAIYMALFSGMAGANPVHAPKKYKRFLKYAADETIHWWTREIKKNPRLEMLSSETLVGMTYIQYLRYWKKEPNIYSSIDDPTLAQMRELSDAGIEYYEGLDDMPERLLATHFAIPKEDTVACSKLQLDCAEKTNADHTVMPNFHNPIIEDPRRLKEVTEIAEAMALKPRAPKIEPKPRRNEPFTEYVAA